MRSILHQTNLTLPACPAALGGVSNADIIYALTSRAVDSVPSSAAISSRDLTGFRRAV